MDLPSVKPSSSSSTASTESTPSLSSASTANATAASSSLKFATFRSFVDSAFFHELSARKLNEIKLDETQIPVLGSYTFAPPSVQFASLSVSKPSFNATDYDQLKYTAPPSFAAPGTLLDLNTVESFKSHDRAGLVRDKLQHIATAITTGGALKNPAVLTAFQVLMFSDLKKYNFYYWFAFPAPLIDWKAAPAIPVDVSPALLTAVDAWRKQVDEVQWGFFLLRQEQQANADAETDESWTVSALQDYESFLSAESGDVQYLAFVDPSPHENVAGWPLRNLLLLAFHLDLFARFPSLQVLAYRGGRALATQAKSFALHGLASPLGKEDLEAYLAAVPKATGWERLPSTNKLAPKHTNLGSLIDPVQLADQAVDLNLKLMKWRVAPDIDLDVVKNTKCLLLGAGTLGSYIARALMGWGVRSITFVDSGRVSYSNPVRQPLYTFADCADGGRAKAECAAEALKKIYPSMDARGVQLEIPMAGHAVHDETTQRRDYEELERLIAEHDVVFLLMDSRESRWLPTVMCAAQSKLVINAALGFDSYVVMRHGVLEKDEHPNLGCYFCNDVVAPLDSTSNRTLDQMCTVTRPGVAMLASANAVELLVSVLQHPYRGLAPSTKTKEEDEQEEKDAPHAAFGFRIPHQLRGFLGTFDSLKVTGAAYPSCSACSGPVRKEWASRGWDFVKDALNDPKYVEELSGLAEIQRMTEELDLGDGDDDWALSD